MINRAHTVATLTAAGLLALAGCSSSSGNSTPAPDPRAAALKAATDYQEAANRRDWATACALSSARLRGGTVADCEKDHEANPASPSASASPSSMLPPPTYADGSTPQPPTSTPNGPDNASDGPVSAGDAVSVPAADAHPAGYGVFLTFTVAWPGQQPSMDHRALRLVDEAGEWKVDQHEDNITGADQLRAVLGG